MADHCVGDTSVMPATALLEMALAAGRELAPGCGIAVADVALERALALPEGTEFVVQTVLTPASAGHRLEVFSRGTTLPQWTRHASGDIVPVNAPASPVSLDELRRLCSEEVPVEAVYDRLARQGLRYGPSFRLLRQVWRGDGQALGRVEVSEDPPFDTEGYWFHPAVLDACLQVIAAMRETDVPRTIVPVRVERWEVFGRPGPRLWSHATLQAAGEPGHVAEFTVNVDTIDTAGLRIARLTGLRLRQVDASALLVRPEGKPGSDLIPPPSTVQLHAPWRQLLDQSPPGNRLRLLVRLLRAEVATVLGWDSADRVGAKQNLFEVGMDSMTSLELQVRLQKNLGCELPLSLAFDYPNVQALAAHITERLFPAAEDATGDDHPDEPSEDLERLAAMSDQEVQSLLRDEYKHLLESPPDRREADRSETNVIGDHKQST
jgi:acyl carrier protein